LIGRLLAGVNYLGGRMAAIRRPLPLRRMRPSLAIIVVLVPASSRDSPSPMAPGQPC